MTKTVVKIILEGVVYGIVYALTKDYVTALLAVAVSCLIEINQILDETENAVKEQTSFLKKFYDKEKGG